MPSSVCQTTFHTFVILRPETRCVWLWQWEEMEITDGTAKGMGIIAD